MSKNRQVEIIDNGEIALVRLLEQTLADRPAIANAARRWLSIVAASHCSRLLLDCSGMQRLSTDVLSALIVLDRRLKRRRSKVVLCGISPAVRATFSITRIDRLFEIRDLHAYRSMA